MSHIVTEGGSEWGTPNGEHKDEGEGNRGGGGGGGGGGGTRGGGGGGSSDHGRAPVSSICCRCWRWRCCCSAHPTARAKASRTALPRTRACSLTTALRRRAVTFEGNAVFLRTNLPRTNACSFVAAASCCHLRHSATPLASVRPNQPRTAACNLTAAALRNRCRSRVAAARRTLHCRIARHRRDQACNLTAAAISIRNSAAMRSMADRTKCPRIAACKRTAAARR